MNARTYFFVAVLNASLAAAPGAVAQDGKQATAVLAAFKTPEAVAQFVDSQDVHTRYEAVLAIQSILGDIRKKLEFRSNLLRSFIEAQGKMDAYMKSDAAPGQIIEGRDMSHPPISYDEAMAVAIKIDLADQREEKLFVSKDETPEQLERNFRAQEQLGRSMWQKLHPKLLEAEAMSGYLRDSGQWDAFMKWAGATIAKKDEEHAAEMKARAAQSRAQSEADHEAAKRKANERYAKMQEERKEYIQGVWDRQMQVMRMNTAVKVASEQKYNDQYHYRYSDDDPYYKRRYRNYHLERYSD